MKLIIAIVRDVDAGPALDRLISAGHRVTRIASTGGFLRRGNATLLIGAEIDQVDSVIELFRQVNPPPEPDQHRATIFVVNAPYFEQV